jgi:hypothetical protein
MAKKDEIYLGKAGKVFGPYSAQELDQFSRSGELSQYTWIWDTRSDGWKPLETPPPSPYAKADSGHQTSDWKNVHALCRDHFHILSGQLENVTETGCVFLSSHSGGEPKFSPTGVQLLDLYDPVQKKSTRTRVRIVGVERANHTWVYRLRWNQSPSFS